MGTLTMKDTFAAMFAANKDAVGTVTKQEIGGLLNDRAVAIVKKGLKGKGLFLSPYLDTSAGKAVVANMLAFAVVKWFPTNTRALKASEAMVDSAMRDIADSVNIRGIVNGFIDSLSELDEFDIFIDDGKPGKDETAERTEEA